jgi:hypothetical protein
MNISKNDIYMAGRRKSRDAMMTEKERSPKQRSRIGRSGKDGSWRLAREKDRERGTRKISLRNVTKQGPFIVQMFCTILPVCPLVYMY